MQDTLQGKARGQHFLLSAKVRDFTVMDVANMDEATCFWKIVEMRWGAQEKVICPDCGVISHPYARLKRGQLRCRHCDHHFSPMVNSPFADRKLPFKTLLLMFSLYAASPKGIPSLFLARVLDVQYKTALVLTGKLRECLVRQADTEILSGVIEADGGHFCGKPRKGRIRFKTKPEDVAAKLEAKYQGQPAPKRKPRSRAEARNWARRKLKRVVMVIRESHGQKGMGARKTRIAVAYTENQRVATNLMRKLVEPSSRVMTDENSAYDVLSAWYDHQCVEHSFEFAREDGVNENQAESFFSRMRRAEYGTYHGFRPKYLWDYAQEFAWREDQRRQTEGDKLNDLFKRFFDNGLSRWWRGYWQGHHRPGEYRVEA